MARSLITYIGGKSKIAPWITSHYPDHFCYVEPFAGGCNTLFAKEPSRNEIINDIDGDLVNFLMVVRDDPAKFQKTVDSLPVSRQLYEEWKWGDWPEEPFERAVRYYYIMRQAVGGYSKYKSGWKHTRMINVARTYRNANEEIEEFAQRFRNVAIENLDFREIIRIYDGPDTLFYCDPPYRGCELYYKGDFCDQDHIDLANLLAKIQGKALVSYYADPLINELYKDWWTAEKGVAKYSKVREFGTERPIATEMLFMNFDPADVTMMGRGLFHDITG